MNRVALAAAAAVFGANFVAVTLTRAHEVGVRGYKLILLDKYSLGKAKALYVAKSDPGIHRPFGYDGSFSGTVTIIDMGDTSNRAVYALPYPWRVRYDPVTKYVNNAAAPGDLGAEVFAIKYHTVAKLVAKNLGDGDSASGSQSTRDLDLQAIADPNHTLRVIVTITNPFTGPTDTFCSDFSNLSIKTDTAGKTFKVISKTSTASSTPCEPAYGSPSLAFLVKGDLLD